MFSKPYYSLLSEFFEVQGRNREVATFESEKQLKELIGYFSMHDDERKAIVGRGRKRVLNEHTYDHRMQAIFRIVSSEMGPCA